MQDGSVRVSRGYGSSEGVEKVTYVKVVSTENNKNNGKLKITHYHKIHTYSTIIE